jgi:short-subunit dehydrogenase
MTDVDYHGQTTLITGVSSGIGVEFAREFARRGSDVVLVARRLDRLEKLAAELATTHGIRATGILLDLSLPAAGQMLAGEVARRGLVVTSLINNAAAPSDSSTPRTRSAFRKRSTSTSPASSTSAGRSSGGCGSLVPGC